jgi:hypothetical protein
MYCPLLGTEGNTSQRTAVGSDKDKKTRKLEHPRFQIRKSRMNDPVHSSPDETEYKL